MDHSNVNLEPAMEGASPLQASENVRSIGEIIRDTRNLSADQVEQVLQYQRNHGVKFGEAAIALGAATADDVLRALASQFNYPYGGAERQRASPDLIVLNQPFSLQAEAVRAVRAQLSMRLRRDDASDEKARPAVAVVSPDTGDGKTYLCANLGVALAQLGGRTLVVDADLRSPRLSDVFQVDAGTGLSALLAARGGEQVIKPVQGVHNLFVLPAGAIPPNPLELVEGPAFGLLLRELSSRFEHVVVDTAAAIHGADSTVIAARCGVSLVVARRDLTRIADLQRMAETLNAADAKIAGIVMNEF